MTAQQTSTPGHSRRFSSSSSFGSEQYSSTPSPWKVHPSSSSPSKENNSYQNSPPPTTTTTTTRPSSSSLRDHLRQQQQRHQRKSDKTLKRENSGKSLISEQQSLDDSRHEVVCQLKGKLANLYFGHQTVIEAQANGMGRKRDRRPSLQEQAKVPLGTVMGELKAHRRFSLQQSYADEFTYEGGGQSKSKEEEAEDQQQQDHRAPSISPEDFLTQQSIVAVLTKVAQKPSKNKQSSSSGPRSSSSTRRLRKRVTFASTPSIAALASSSSIPVHECWWTPEELQEIHEMARQECDHYGNAKNYTKAIDTLYKANDKSQANIHRALLVLWKHRAGRGLETLIAADKKHKYVQRHRDSVLEAWDEHVHLVVTTSSSSPSSSLSSQQSAIDKSRRHVRRSSHTASRETTALASALANLDAEDAAVAYFEHMRTDEKQHNRHRRNQSTGAHYQSSSSSSKKKHSRRFSSRW